MISFILNLPYTLVGLILGLISLPKGFKIDKKSQAIIIKVSYLWWAISYIKGARAATIGHVILLGSKVEDGDLEHELIHVAQYKKEPLIHPFLYFIEILRKGYRNNKYEVEAYNKAGNIYKN